MENKVEVLDQTVEVFVNSIENYFLTITGEKVDTKPPFVKEKEDLMLKDCTAMIGVSGSRKGLVFLSANMEMYRDFVTNHIGLANPLDRNLLDMAGEIANVVSGNVREVFGKDFMISVPVVFKGKPEVLQFPKEVPIYVLPFEWKSHKSLVMVGLQ